MNTVFISSTYLDFKEERKAIWDLLTQFNVSIKGMEEFGARKEDSLTTCLIEVEQCDIYIGLFGYRFGSIDKKTGKSYTQIEYEKALELDKNILIYFLDEKESKITPELIEFDKIENLNVFKATLKERHHFDTFKNTEELKLKLKRQFEKYFKNKDNPIQDGDEYLNSKNILEKFFLIPKVYSGSEVKLRVKFNYNPYAASKILCDIFKLEFGKTIGNSISIISPLIDAENFQNIFILYPQIENFLTIDKSKEYEIYGNIWFSENKIETLSTTFKDKSHRVYVGDDLSDEDNHDMPGFYMEKRLGEGKVILTLKEIIKQ